MFRPCDKRGNSYRCLIRANRPDYGQRRERMSVTVNFVETSDVSNAIRNTGISEGETVLVHSDISRIGWIKSAKSREQVTRAYLDAIVDVIGPDGTVMALSCTESFARDSRPYDHETSPSEQGSLSEFIRTRPNALRSLHPLFSVAAIGRDAHRLCGEDVGATGFGHDSPFQKLREADGWILCIGVDLKAMTFVHHVEQTYGVPYGYTKEWTAPITKSGASVTRRFFAFVRYLNAGVEYDFSKLQTDLMDNGLAKTGGLGYGGVWCVRARTVFDFTITQLKKDPFYLLKHPPTSEPWRK